MKKLIALILTGIMVLSFAACGKGKAESSAAESETEAAVETPETLPGGWSTGSLEITDEIRELIEKATADLVGADYEAVAYIGKQIVNGTNHRILCKITPVTQNPVAKYAVVTIYEDLQGNAEIKEILDSEAEAGTGGALGGWKEINPPVVTDEAKAALEKATEKLVGAEYKPVALIATQLVSGTNYLILCEVTAVAPGAEPSYMLVKVYEALDGTAEISETFEFAAQ